MAAKKVEISANAELWAGYRGTFQIFAEKVRSLQSLASEAQRDRTVIEAALLEVEKARLAHNRARDLLALCMIPLPALPGHYHEGTSRVRQLARLLWELSGKPAGTKEDDWYRAERLMRRAAA